MAEGIQDVADHIISVVLTVMDASVDHQQRFLANQTLEKFKDSSPICAECGLYMASSLQLSHVVRHVGLLFVEHCIKFRWNDMEDLQKIAIKNRTMELLAGKIGNVIYDEHHVRSALAKMVVEIIKREWPQHWPDMLSELYALSALGCSQTELVLMVLSGLAEDVVVLQNISGRRRRDIHTSLTASMSEIFNYFMSILKEHSQNYQVKRALPDRLQQEQAMQHCKVCIAVLSTLTIFVDWVNTSHITADDNLLLRVLCTLLAEPLLLPASSECLLAIVSRKGKIEDRKPLLILFEESALATIYEAVRNVSMEAQHNDGQYMVLKRLCQILTALGSQLCALWGAVPGVGCPQNFATYLEVILHFTSHPSQVINQITYPLWLSFLRQKEFDSNADLKAVLPRLIEGVTQKLIKVGFPSRMDFLCCTFSRFDFDCDEEFVAFFSKFRNEISNLLRIATTKEPLMAFSYASQWLRLQLRKPIESGEGAVCSINSPSYLEWDALSVCLDCVLGRVMCADNPNPPVAEGVQLLTEVINYTTQDPLILSEILSCISALVVFLTAAPETLPVVLNKIFSLVVFTVPGQRKGNRSRAVKNVRRHACSSLVKVCKNYPRLLLPLFGEVYNLYKQFSDDTEELSQMEKSTLMEALILISNQFENFEKQSAFLREILGPVTAIWLSNEMRSVLSSVKNFFEFIGLGKPPVQPSTNDQCGINRSQVLHWVNTILAVIKRAKWPDDIEACRRGGFLVPSTDPTITIPINPAAKHLLLFVPNVLHCIRMTNCLWQPSIREMVHIEYYKAYEMCELEKSNILGTTITSCYVPDSYVKPVHERMQHFLSQFSSNCFHILGNIGPAFGHDFYTFPNLAMQLVNLVMPDLDYVPDYRLRPLIRIFLRSFAGSCPADLRQTVVLPVLAAICPYMHLRLKKKWAHLHEATEVSRDDDTRDVQEIVEEQLARHITREYINLLGSLLVAKKGSGQDFNNDVMMEEDDMPMTNSADTGPSELGLLVFQNMDVCSAVVQCLFDTLCWNDTLACTKCIPLCQLAMKLLIAEQILGPDDAAQLFLRTLMCLQMHGHQESIQSLILNLGMSTYESLRPQFDCITKILMMVPGVSEAEVKAYDAYIEGKTTKSLTEKRKREMFRGLVNGVIGVSMAQLFPRHVDIKNLPPLLRPKKPRTKQLLDIEGSDIGICSLFSDNATNDL